MAITIVNQPVLSHEWDFCLREIEVRDKIKYVQLTRFGASALLAAHLSRPVSL